MKKILICLLINNFNIFSQTKDEIKKYIKELNLPEETYQIIMYETAYLTSNSFKIDNNLFGMQCPKKRYSTFKKCRVYKGHQFAQYADWKSSIIDFLYYYIYNNKKHYILFRDFYILLEEFKYNTINKNYYKILKKIKYD